MITLTYWAEILILVAIGIADLYLFLVILKRRRDRK
jgi:hypothetical protein